MPAFSQGILTDAYKSELQQNIEEIEALKKLIEQYEEEMWWMR